MYDKFVKHFSHNIVYGSVKCGRKVNYFTMEVSKSSTVIACISRPKTNYCSANILNETN